LGSMFPLQPWLGLLSTSRAPLGPLPEKSLLKTQLKDLGGGRGGRGAAWQVSVPPIERWVGAGVEALAQK
jgi:hypothetical protein